LLHRGPGHIRLWDLTPLQLSRIPVGQIDPRYAATAETMLKNQNDIKPREQAWLQYLIASYHWWARFKIEIEKSRRHIQAGEYDIEIERT